MKRHRTITIQQSSKRDGFDGETIALFLFNSFRISGLTIALGYFSGLFIPRTLFNCPRKLQWGYRNDILIDKVSLVLNVPRLSPRFVRNQSPDTFIDGKRRIRAIKLNRFVENPEQSHCVTIISLIMPITGTPYLGTYTSNIVWFKSVLK